MSVWVGATAARRRTAWVAGIIFVTLTIPAIIGTVGMAHSDTLAGGTNRSSGLSWMNVKDSYGVPLSSYMFSTDNGSLLNPGNTAMSMVLRLEAAGYLIIVTTAVWFIGYALSFAWLDMFSKALTGVADALTGQIATPMLLGVAAAIGAFFVGYFIVRGYHAKATMQVVTMIGIAVVGPVFLAEPLGEVLSSHGLLGQGRDFGVAIAAGINGDHSPNPHALVPAIQHDMADNFARKPLQVWNFGHVVDVRPACRTGWSSAVLTGDSTNIQKAMKNCDTTAYNAARDPNEAQIGTGLLLLACATIMLLFAIYLGIKVIKAALECIYHGFMSIFGFAAGGFVYGPSQTFLIRNIVHGFVAAGEMAANTIFLGVYLLFLGNLFEQARGQVMAVFIIGAVVELIAITQLRKLSATFKRGNEWVANRIALGIQSPQPVGAGGGGGGGGSGGRALGMGVGGHAGMGGMGLIAGLAGLSTLNASPVTAWAWGKTNNPMAPYSRLRRAAEIGQWGAWSGEAGGVNGIWANSYVKQRQYAMGALRGAESVGGVNTARGAAAAIQGLYDVGGDLDTAMGALRMAGFTDDRMIIDAIRARGIVERNAEDETLADKHLGNTVAALKRAQHLTDVDSPQRMEAYYALQASMHSFRRANPGGVTLNATQMAHAQDYINAPTEAKILELQRRANGNGTTLQHFSKDEAARMMKWIGNEHARLGMDAANDLLNNPNDPQRIRELRRILGDATDTDQWASGVHRTPWNSLSPPR